jgi:cysteine-rich repeat protein
LTLGFCAAFPQSSSNGSVASSSGSNGSNSSVGSNGSSGSNGSNGSSGSNGSTGSNGSNGSSGSNGSTGSSGSNGSTGSNASGASSNGGGGDQCAPICGDGVIVGNETCDDGNTTNGDGCSSTCKREGSTSSDNSSSRSGGSSSGNGSSTSAVCGNGRKEGAEDCDDGNTTNGDGCSSTCKIEQCYVTPPPPPNCASTPAGESLIEHVCAITANGNFACQQHAVTLAVSATARVRGVYTWDTALRDLGFAATGQICGTATVTVAVDGAVTRRFDDTFGVATIPSRLAFDLDLTAGNHAIDVRAQGSLQNCTVNGQQQPSATPTRWKGKLSFETIACSAASSSGGGNSSGAGSSVGAPGGQCPAGFNPLIIGGAAGCPNGDPPPCNGTLEANGSYTDQDGCNNVCYRCNTSSNSSAGVNAGGQCAAGYSDLSQGGAPPGESCPIGDPRPCPSGQVREYGQGYIEPNGCRHICTRCVPA